MNRKLDPDIIRLGDILAAIADIEKFCENSTFEDRKTIMAIAYVIAIIGEAASNLPTAFRDRYAQIPWNAIIGMHHRIIHGYGKVSIDRLREVVDKHLPNLKIQIQTILQQLS